MSEAAKVQKDAFRGLVALGTRQVLVQGSNLLGGVLLARLLSPQDFGLYATLAFMLQFLIVFGDIGLGASLVRQRTTPTLREERGVFAFQQVVVTIFGGLLLVFAPAVVGFYRLESDAVWLFRAVGIALFVTSLQTIPAIRLERELRFDRLAIVEVAQAVLFNATIVALAAIGFGPSSFAVGLVVRSLVGAILLNVLHPWPIGWAWLGHGLREHLRFGLPYQGISFVSLLKDSVMPMFIGGTLGLSAVGYLNWAQTFAAYPVMALMVLQRLYMPVFARMQDHPRELPDFVERVLKLTNGITAIAAALTFALAEELTAVVFGGKWLVALPLFYVLWIGNVFVATATPLLGLLNALGRSRTAFGFAVLWMVCTWGFSLLLIPFFGEMGFALATFGVHLTNLLLYRQAQRLVPFRILPVVLPFWFAALGIGAIVWTVARLFDFSNLFSLGALMVLGVCGYAAVLAARYPLEARRVADAFTRRAIRRPE